MGRHHRRRDPDQLTWPPREDEVNVMDLDADLPPPLESPGGDAARRPPFPPPSAGEAPTPSRSDGQYSSSRDQVPRGIREPGLPGRHEDEGPRARREQVLPGRHEDALRERPQRAAPHAHERVAPETRPQAPSEAHVLPPPRTHVAARHDVARPRPGSRWSRALKRTGERLRQLPLPGTFSPGGGRSGLALLLLAGLAVVAAAVMLVPPGRLAAAVSLPRVPGIGQPIGPRGTSGRGDAAEPRGVAGTATKAAAPSSVALAPTSSTTAYLAVRTQPAGATVFLDDRRVGNAPVTVPQLEAGEHTVVIRSGSQTVRHQINAAAGEVISLLVPLTTSASAAAPEASSMSTGIKVQAPIEVRVFEGDRLLGTSQMASIPLAAGTHRLLLRNDAVGYRDERTVSVSAGRTAALDVKMPEQRVAINAIPWAEVSVDGTVVGETPIGNLSLALGPHTIVLRHPQLGAKTLETVVKANEPGRISVDMRNK
jgi:hypothetical protein